ncbi:polyprenyl synthetase family protein [Streptomyces sp. DASNCL29]|uniref:polyprenyl synthetase family protein n=1 Tax=Streptomyces sp. DASNCL29 TaxID=2583819 RepID=UPI001F11194F|nr:polyprenyl synthetase family protein [Streptomyces sp. DASNCL29]
MTVHTMATPHPAPAPATTARRTLMSLLPRVEERLRTFLSGEYERWHGLDPRSSVPVDAIADLVGAGGKRMRPAFCLSGYLAAGGDPEDGRVIPVAAALELLHACALIHDDVMDESAVRRGSPTVHTSQAALHRERGWQGTAERFGENVAILAGDLALVYSDEIMAEVEPAVAAEWHLLRSELIIGQYMDVAASVEFQPDPETSRWIAIAKSGRYTIHRPLVLGAAVAGRADAAPAFEEYGAALGEAFQLRDDLLDAFGDSEVTGKPSGLDFEQHKMTLLMALAIQRNAHIRELVPAQLRGADHLRRLLIETGVRDDVEKHIDGLVERACRAIAEAPLEPEWREELAAMAHEVAYRSA